MPKVEFKRVQTDEEVENIDIKDGQLIYTGTGKTFMDYGNERIPTGSGGGSVDVDTEMSDTSENAVQNKVIKEYVDDQVSSIEVIISNSEPTSTGNKIWIDTGEVGSAVSEITNEYSTSTGLGYSANYINNNVGIVESGSNTNGNYIKFADGTMICYAILSFNLEITNQYEGVYYANTGSITFPQEFISTPVINIMLRGIAGGGYSFYNVLTSEFSGFVWKIQSKTSEFSLLYQAIGRWK